MDLAIGIGGAAGQGIATPGDVLARIFVRRGLHLNTYNAYQSIVRGGHILLTLRTSDRPVLTAGDKLDVLVTLNQDTMDRHLGLMGSGSVVLYNADKIRAGTPADGVQLCPFSVKDLAPAAKGDLVQNTIALGAILQLVGVEFGVLDEILTLQFRKKGQAAIDENVGVARAGYDYAAEHFAPFPTRLPTLAKPLAFVDGNSALAMGGAAAGVRFYCAYPMSPSTGVLHWMARHAEQLGIMVRQVEDELGVINMAGTFQCPGIILSDLLISEGRSSVDPDELSFVVPIDRGALIGANGTNGSNGHATNGNGSNGHAAEELAAYKRYEFTDSGVSPRAIPGTPGYVHVVATDEHDDEGGLISDEYTNPHKRQAMHEKRMRKMEGILPLIEPPTVFGSADADVTLLGWGSTEGVIREAIE